MTDASERLDFETAARCRDQIAAIEKEIARAKSTVIPPSGAVLSVLEGLGSTPIDTGVKLAGYTTSLNGNIAMNFYMDLSE